MLRHFPRIFVGGVSPLYFVCFCAQTRPNSAGGDDGDVTESSRPDRRRCWLGIISSLKAQQSLSLVRFEVLKQLVLDKTSDTSGS
jgi:hypothetical protein